MNAALSELPIDPAETPVPCPNCSAVQRLEQAFARLRTEFRCEVGLPERIRPQANPCADGLDEGLPRAALLRPPEKNFRRAP